MGCGKSKHSNVASGNTVLQSKKSNVSNYKKRQETKTEIISNDIEDVSSSVAQKESENVKDVYGNVNGSDAVIGKTKTSDVPEKNPLEKSKEVTKVEEIVSDGTSSEKSKGKKEDLLMEKDSKVNDATTKKKELAIEGEKEIFEEGEEDPLKDNEEKRNGAIVKEKEIPDEIKKSKEEKEDLMEKNEDVNVKEENIKNMQASTLRAEENEENIEEKI